LPENKGFTASSILSLQHDESAETPTTAVEATVVTFIKLRRESDFVLLITGILFKVNSYSRQDIFLYYSTIRCKCLIADYWFGKRLKYAAPVLPFGYLKAMQQFDLQIRT
jgi:hypothetical protein